MRCGPILQIRPRPIRMPREPCWDSCASALDCRWFWDACNRWRTRSACLKTAQGAGLSESKSHSPKGAGDMEIRLRRVGWLPGIVASRFFPSLHPKEIHPPHRIRIKLRRQSLHGDGQLCIPGMRLLIQRHGPFHAALEIGLRAGRDVEIEPETVRAHLEFFVGMGSGRIGLQEGLSYIALPEMITPPIWIGIGEHVKPTIAALKTQI